MPTDLCRSSYHYIGGTHQELTLGVEMYKLCWLLCKCPARLIKILSKSQYGEHPNHRSRDIVIKVERCARTASQCRAADVPWPTNLVLQTWRRHACFGTDPNKCHTIVMLIVFSVEKQCKSDLFQFIVNHVYYVLGFFFFVFFYHVVQLYCVIMTHDEKLAQWTSEKLWELISVCEMKETQASLCASIPPSGLTFKTIEAIPLILFLFVGLLKFSWTTSTRNQMRLNPIRPFLRMTRHSEIPQSHGVHRGWR